jgi:hypothetical protein
MSTVTRLSTLFSLPMMAAALLAHVPSALAADPPKAETKASDSATGDDSGKDSDKPADKEADKAADKEGADARASSPKADPLDPKEDPSKGYFFLGARWRQYIIPPFFFDLFANGGFPVVSPPSGGLELGYRKGGLEIDFSASYADFGLGDTVFRGKNEPPTANEIVRSTLKLASFELDVLWDIPIDKEGRFSFLLGGGVGFSIVADDFTRVQAYPKAGSDPNSLAASDWERCTGLGVPNQQYCENNNGHFTTNGKDFNEPSWANGGSKPLVFPVLVLPQLSFRAKPIKQLALRVDTGFSITGFFAGLGAAYGF